MAWATTHVFTVGEILTAANMNLIQANINETMVAKVTTKGDLTPATGANALTRLGVGANDTVLMAASGETTGLKWGTVSGMKKITGTGYQWYINTGSNVPYAVLTATSASVDTYSAYVQVTASTAQKDELTHVYARCDNGQVGNTGTGHLQIASGGAGSETVITSMLWTHFGTASYNPTPPTGPITLPIVVEVAASTRIAIRNKFSATGGSSLIAQVNIGYVKASDITDFT